jgi:hypothetical protein
MNTALKTSDYVKTGNYLISRMIVSNRRKTLHHADDNIFLSFFSFLGSTAQSRPWHPPQNPAEFLGGFSTFSFFTE